MRWPFDNGLLFLSALLFAIGLVALFSATGGGNYFYQQLMWGGIGFLAMAALAWMPLPAIEWVSPAAFAAGVLALIAVFFFGVEVNNARRWIDIGLRVQPSEAMKILVPLALAFYYARLPQIRWFHHFGAAAILALPTILVLREPDLGTAVMIGATGAAVIFFAGLAWGWIVGGFTLALFALPLLWRFVLKPYQRARIETLFDPAADPLGAGYHTIQAEIAVGSGGVWGKGFMSGTQAQLGFLPERHTDFIFAVFAEEFGLVGALALLVCAALLTWRILAIAGANRSLFGKLALGGLAASFIFTTTVNLGMVSGLLPVVGMPLPLVSYGGTALVAQFAAFGVAHAAARRPPTPR